MIIFKKLKNALHGGHVEKLYLKLMRLCLHIVLYVNCSRTELHCTKHFYSDNQFEVVEEFQYLEDNHSHCRDKQILITDNLGSYKVSPDWRAFRFNKRTNNMYSGL